MNALTLIIFAAAAFILAYRFYARRIESIWDVDPSRPTPAHTRCDGRDFVPAKHWLILFGHHFSSIAGAGPIVGPIIALTVWGWLPALLWVVFGSIFLGSVHDFGSLMMAVREKGTSIGDIAEMTISRRAKLLLSIFTLLALILVVAVFAYFAADTFVKEPDIIIPSLGLIPVAVITGFFLYKLNANTVIVTIAGLLALAGLMKLGALFPIDLGANALTVWMVVLLVYCLFASVAPVNILLQPRDYLSSYLLFAGILLGVAGLVVTRPAMNTPAFTGFDSPMGWLWPMMFITVACGANSGFHSLIASGTTCKQLSSEADAKKIAFGGMLLEGFLAALVIAIVAGGFSLAEFHAHVAAKSSPVNMYGLGFGKVTSSFLGGWGGAFAIMVLNAFILTTLDTATRIARYIAEELTGIRNRYLSTVTIVVLAGWLALGKDSVNTPIWQVIWPAFGASNQLVAALALLVITCWLLGKNKPIRYALPPALFMLATSMTALVFQLGGYWQKKQIVLIAVSLVLIVCALSLGWEVLKVFRKRK
ncbi:MAG: carbon starvation protein A [Candidatus Omnitrophota bacterium]|nr:carbon starvation protein A [Candidatus Omnitrophota bacterium]MDZ4242221.1 carbon starvation protein A [Candidatus Omnitrophota bacterium]